VLDDKLWSRVQEASEKLGASVTLAPFDAEFISVLNDSKIKTLSDFGNVQKVHGLLDNEKSRIEIRINAKKKRNIPFQDFGKSAGELFEQFSVKRRRQEGTADSARTIILVQNSIGLIASYEFNPKRFNLDNLEFHIDEIAVSDEMNYSVLSKLTYDNKELKKTNDDFLVSGMMAVIK
jgi:hypothetical protein